MHKVAGRFKLQIFNANRTKCRRCLEFNNLIVDVGLERLAELKVGLNTMANRAAVGTGTTTPSVSNVALANAVGNVSGLPATSNNNNSGASPWWHELTNTWEFNTAGDNGIDGVALAEIGIFRAASGGVGQDMWSRALILDELGDPTTITLLPEEVLVITYTIRVNIDESDKMGTFQLNSETWNYVLRVANAGSSSHLSIPWPDVRVHSYNSQTLGSITSFPPGSNSASAGISFDAYTAAATHRDLSLFIGVNEGNFAEGIGAFSVSRSVGSNTSLYQFSVSKDSDSSLIPKTDEETLTMGSFLRIGFERV